MGLSNKLSRIKVLTRLSPNSHCILLTALSPRLDFPTLDLTLRALQNLDLNFGLELVNYSECRKMKIFTVVLRMTQFPWTTLKYLKKSAETIVEYSMTTEDPSHLVANV